MKRHIERTRLVLTFFAILLVYGALLWRLFDIAWYHHSWYSQAAQSQAAGSTMLLRGNIYLSDGPGQDFLVAVNKKFPALVLIPAKMDQTHLDSSLSQLSSITGVDPQQLRTVASSGLTTSRVVIHHLTDAQAGQINSLGIAGVGIGYENDRFYPAHQLAADVIGFLGYDQTGRHGQYGVESSYEQELSGSKSGAWADTHFNPLSEIKALVGARSGSSDTTTDAPEDVILTIDKNVQSYIQDTLSAVLKKYQAASGVIVVQDPTSGKILGMADSPSFDPNTYSSAPTEAFLNGAVQVPFEPGSSFKPFTMAAGLDLGKITPDTTYNDDKDITIDGYTIKNFNEGHFGVVTMTQVLEKSINAGTMFVQSLLTHDQFLNYVINEGFGQRTGIDLPGEVSGTIDNLYTNRPINFMTASFGQGITVTPLQLINAYSAIANGGKLMRPYVVATTRDSHGVLVPTQPQVLGTPFTAKTAATLRTMLVSVVDKGFDKARIPHYDVAGKTGTAQIADPVHGGYLEKQYNHTFVGFVPGNAPQFVILVKMERPQGITFAADSLSPVFKDVAQFLINYFHIPPTR